MKWILWTLVLLALLVGVVAVTGWMLPVNHEASRSAEFRRPPQDVYDLVSDFRKYPDWWTDISKVDLLVEAPNRTTFRQHSSDGPILMSVREAVPPSKFVTFIDDESQPFGGSWTFEIVPVGENRTRLTITERGEIYNPIFRALARFVFGYTGTMESFLAAAQERLR